MNADTAAALIAALSFLIAAWAFLRDAGLRQFEICLRLSERIEELWASLRSEKDAEEYKLRLIAVLNHYERCCCYINAFALLKGTPHQILKGQVLETLKRNWEQPFFQEVLREAASGNDTYREIRKVMAQSKAFQSR